MSNKVGIDVNMLLLLMLLGILRVCRCRILVMNSRSSKLRDLSKFGLVRRACDKSWSTYGSPNHHTNIKISHSGSKGQYKGDTRNYILWDPYVSTVLCILYTLYTILGIPEAVFCGILLLMWSFGVLTEASLEHSLVPLKAPKQTWPLL